MIYTAVFCFFISHTDSRIPLSVLSANQEFQDHLPWLLLEVHSFSPFSPWFLFAKVHEIQAYHHTHIYIYSTYPQDSPKIYLSRVVDSQVSQFWSPSGSFSFRSGLHGGDDAQRFSWPNPVLPIHNGQARLNATPFRLWIFAAVWRSFNRLKILQLERQLHRSSLIYLNILDSLGCFYMFLSECHHEPL